MSGSLDDIQAGVEEELRRGGHHHRRHAADTLKSAAVDSKSIKLRLLAMLAAPAQKCRFWTARVFVYSTPMAAPIGGAGGAH